MALRPTSISGLELCRTLELMGLTRHYQAGPYVIFIDQYGGNRVLFVTEGWDIPAEDIERTLQVNRINVPEFWRCYESLFQT